MHTQTVTVDPPDAPTFINPPADITVDCNNIPTGAALGLSYTNNQSGACEIAGTVMPTQSGSADVCGGTISYMWQFTDQCGTNISHTQNITVTPIDPVMFINPPADITVDCNNIPTGSCLLYTSPSPRDQRGSRMPSSA